MAGEQFGMRAVDLAGAESDTSAMQIEGLAKAGGQGLGNAVDGYNQANFNQAIQDGEAYLNQMADELDIPPEKRAMIKFFSGNPEAVKRGAQFLMDSTEQQRKDTGVKNILGLSQGINEKYKGLSADIFNQEGMTPEDMKTAQDQLISDKSGEMEGLKIGSKDKYDLAGYDAVHGGGAGDDWARNNEMEKLKLRRRQQESIEKKRKTEVSKFDIGQQNKAFKASNLSSPTGINAMKRTSESLVKSVEEAYVVAEVGKDGKEIPGFLPWSSWDQAPQWMKSASEKVGWSNEDYNRKAKKLRGGIGRYLDTYKKFISGTAVSDAEYNKLLNNLAAGDTHTFGQFIDAFIAMTEKDMNIYNDNYDAVRKSFPLLDGRSALEVNGTPNPGVFMENLVTRLKSIRSSMDGSEPIPMDSKAFHTEQGLANITQADRDAAEKLKEKELNAGDKSGGLTLRQMGMGKTTINGIEYEIGGEDDWQ
jgi:hypothetical protein